MVVLCIYMGTYKSVVFSIGSFSWWLLYIIRKDHGHNFFTDMLLYDVFGVLFICFINFNFIKNYISKDNNT